MCSLLADRVLISLSPRYNERTHSNEITKPSLSPSSSFTLSNGLNDKARAAGGGGGVGGGAGGGGIVTGTRPRRGDCEGRDREGGGGGRTLVSRCSGLLSRT
jgi:hypothetical protein